MDILSNYIFACLKNKKGNIIVWIVINVFEIFFIDCKVYMFKAWHKAQIFFTCSKHSNFENGQSLFFSNVFFYTKCAPFLLKIGKQFNIDD